MQQILHRSSLKHAVRSIHIKHLHDVQSGLASNLIIFSALRQFEAKHELALYECVQLANHVRLPLYLEPQDNRSLHIVKDPIVLFEGPISPKKQLTITK